jgi:ribonucleoside-triphosphate reductase (thioredoxin)
MNKELPTQYQSFIHLSRYSRWLEEEGRRENWGDTVTRYMDFFKGHLELTLSYKMSPAIYGEVKNAILNLEVMPSMRCLMTAGDALKKDMVAGYNCSYVAINRVRAFDEILYILMCGTGVGFSVEREYVSKLPTIAEEFTDSDTTIVVQDSRIGWCKALRELISLLITGQVPKWDMSKVRPNGSRLKTFGGRSSGPESLDEMFRFTVDNFKKAAGRKMTSLECHDQVCKIAEIVVVGGVRRAALISLSSLTDERMRGAKSGSWWVIDPQRALSNNSVCYKEKPEIGTFMHEWLSLYESKSGERGIFNRAAAQRTVERIDGGRRESNHEFGTNPCSEIILRDREFCNLSEVVARGDDTEEDLHRKMRIAAIIGTWQSTLTDFRYLSAEWKKNCEEERLLGVSITGIMDNAILNGNTEPENLPNVLAGLRKKAISTNKEWSDRLGISQSAAITCVKPSGTVSQLVDAASGIHARHNPYYIRTVRASIKDPICTFMVDQGFPHEKCAMKPDTTMVFSFPIESPSKAVFRKDKSAIEQLELWLIYQNYFCEHKPSVTISVKEEEWMNVGSWVYDHFDGISGISFLPFSDHSYKQAPYQDCTKEEYKTLLTKMPVDVDWSGLNQYEEEDNTSGSQTLACSAGSCELVDLSDPS